MSDGGVADMPGPDLARALLNLAPAGLSSQELIAGVGGWEQLISWAQAQQNDLLAELDRNPFRVAGKVPDTNDHTGGDTGDTGDTGDAGGDGGGSRWTCDDLRWLSEELGLALGVSGSSAYFRVRTAVTLVDTLPTVHEALRAGQLTVHHARVAAKHVNHVAEQIARAVDAAVMTDQDWRTPHQMERVVARTVIELTPTAPPNRPGPRNGAGGCRCGTNRTG